MKTGDFHMKIGSFRENWMKSLFLVLSHIGLAVSLVQKGGACAHWWPDFI